MGTIALAVNPASGRDIRRIISSATVFDNKEKQNIAERIILAAMKFGQSDFLLMPDSHFFRERIESRMEDDGVIPGPGFLRMPEKMPVLDDQIDTEHFARLAEEDGADVLVVLGGDGTSRAAAKGLRDLPILPISTGTNNVYPNVIEGTIAGVAAAAIAAGVVKKEECCQKSKVIRIFKNGKPEDIALIDAVFARPVFTASKAIWDCDDIIRVVVTQCHPSSIGFSALPGTRMIVRPEDECAVVVELGTGRPNTRVSIAAGSIEDVEIRETARLELDQQLVYRMEEPGVLAFDGERELVYAAGDEIRLIVSRTGPWKIHTARAVELAQQRGFFEL